MTNHPLLLGLLILAGVLWGWWAALRWRYRVRASPPERIFVTTPDGWRLSVWRRAASVRRFEEPVILAHGLSANRFNFDFEPPYSLAHALSEAGFDCYSVEWRGAGGSARPWAFWSNWTVETHMQVDAPAVLKEVLLRAGAERALWVGHSMGGLVGYAVAQGPLGKRLAGLVTLGSPVFFSLSPLLLRALRLAPWVAFPFQFRMSHLARLLSPLLGWVTLPLSDVLLNPRHIAPSWQRKIVANLISDVPRGVISQFRTWIFSGRWLSADGTVDYREGLSRLRLPVLVLAGSQDQLAAPEGIEQAFTLLGSEDKRLIVFGRSHGDAHDYGHGDLVFGSGAPTEVYPEISRWLAAHATRREA